MGKMPKKKKKKSKDTGKDGNKKDKGKDGNKRLDKKNPDKLASKGEKESKTCLNKLELALDDNDVPVLLEALEEAESKGYTGDVVDEARLKAKAHGVTERLSTGIRLASGDAGGSSDEEAIDTLSSAVRDADKLEVDEILLGTAFRILYEHQSRVLSATKKELSDIRHDHHNALSDMKQTDTQKELAEARQASLDEMESHTRCKVQADTLRLQLTGAAFTGGIVLEGLSRCREKVDNSALELASCMQKEVAESSKASSLQNDLTICGAELTESKMSVDKLLANVAQCSVDLTQCSSAIVSLQQDLVSLAHTREHRHSREGIEDTLLAAIIRGYASVPENTRASFNNLFATLATPDTTPALTEGLTKISLALADNINSNSNINNKHLLLMRSIERSNAAIADLTDALEVSSGVVVLVGWMLAALFVVGVVYPATLWAGRKAVQGARWIFQTTGRIFEWIVVCARWFWLDMIVDGSNRVVATAVASFAGAMAGLVWVWGGVVVGFFGVVAGLGRLSGEFMAVTVDGFKGRCGGTRVGL